LSALVELLEARGGDEGARIIYDLLQRINDDFNTARRLERRDEMAELAAARAQLTGHLVEWARDNPNENIRNFTYQYRVFDADSQLQAALLTSDPAQRTQRLQAARERFEALRDEAENPQEADPVVQLGLASALFEPGDYQGAQPLYGRLLMDQKLGRPRMQRGDDWVDNDRYWEATYRLFRS